MDEKLKDQVIDLIKSELSLSIEVEDEVGYCSYNNKNIKVSLLIKGEKISSQYATINVES